MILSYTQLNLISEQNLNCWDPRADLIQALPDLGVLGFVWQKFNFSRHWLLLNIIIFFLGALRAPKKALIENLFLEKKSGVQSIGNCLICLDPKSCIFTFLEEALKIFVSHFRDLKNKNYKISFLKMVFKSGVQSIGNCSICLDSKSCFLTFYKKLWKFLCRVSGT